MKLHLQHKGSRKMKFGIIALSFLTIGFALALRHPDTGPVSFPAFATAVTGIMLSLVGGNAAEHLASRGQETSPGQESAVGGVEHQKDEGELVEGADPTVGFKAVKS